jgi:Glycosyl transferase family 90
MVERGPLVEVCAPAIHASHSLIWAEWFNWTSGDLREALTRYGAALSIYAGALLPDVHLSVKIDDHRVPSCLWTLVSIRPGRIDLTMNREFFRPLHYAVTSATRLCCMIPIFAAIARDASPTEFIISLGDDADADVGFSGTGNSLLIPDSDFMGTLGHSSFKHHVLSAWMNWTDRRRRVFWRGSTTGIPRDASTYDPEREWFRVLPRTEVCYRLRTGFYRDFCDVAISAVVQIDNKQLADRIMLELGGGVVDRIRQLEYRYLLDIDGNTNAWSGLFQALTMGACVIKIASPNNFSQWYYDRLIPWKNYVPVKSDLSDLEKKVEWAIDHPDDAQKIGFCGRELALSMTFEKEVSDATHAIVQRFGKGSHASQGARKLAETPSAQTPVEVVAPQQPNPSKISEIRKLLSGFRRSPRPPLPRLQNVSASERCAHYRHFAAIAPAGLVASPEQEAQRDNGEAAEYFYLTHSVLRADRDFVLIALGANAGRWVIAARNAYRQVQPRGRFRSITVDPNLVDLEAVRRVQAEADLDMSTNVLCNAQVAAQDKAAPDPNGSVHGEPGETYATVSIASLSAPFAYVDLILCDVRGSEPEMFAAALETLQHKVGICCVKVYTMLNDLQLRSFFWALQWEPLLLLSPEISSRGNTSKAGHLVVSNPRLVR